MGVTLRAAWGVTGETNLHYRGSDRPECSLYDLSENVSATAREVATPLWLKGRSGIDCGMVLRISKTEDTN